MILLISFMKKSLSKDNTLFWTYKAKTSRINPDMNMNIWLHVRISLKHSFLLRSTYVCLRFLRLMFDYSNTKPTFSLVAYHFWCAYVKPIVKHIIHTFEPYIRYDDCHWHLLSWLIFSLDFLFFWIHSCVNLSNIWNNTYKL